ncbi:MAG: 3-isopropylmalate dehydrogenase [Flavobacteriaceae bacterium]
MIKIAVLPGDGIGPEIIEESLKVVESVSKKIDIKFDYKFCDVGAIAIDKYNNPLPDETLKICKESDAVLFGAIGHPKFDNNPNLKIRPEQGLLKLRKELGLYANLRPVKSYKELLSLSPLKKNIIENVDMLIVRELTGGLYFGEKKSSNTFSSDLCTYTVDEIERVTSIAIDFAKKRRNKITLVDKANVLETSRLWRKTVQEISLKHPEVELDYMFVDNAAMQIILNPKQFDVILTENLFGDIISDEASVIGGSIGILSSASIGGSMGLFEPIHGSFPQATNKNIANPVAAILSASMMLNYLNLGNGAKMIEKAVENSLINKVSTADINNISPSKTSQVGDYISNFIKENNYILFSIFFVIFKLLFQIRQCLNITKS